MDYPVLGVSLEYACGADSVSCWAEASIQLPSVYPYVEWSVYTDDTYDSILFKDLSSDQSGGNVYTVGILSTASEFALILYAPDGNGGRKLEAQQHVSLGTMVPTGWDSASMGDITIGAAHVEIHEIRVHRSVDSITHWNADVASMDARWR
jgi:hypothetical protein